MKQLTILGISGSLKTTSSNTRLLQFLKTVLPQTVNYTVITNLDTLPHFNPEKETGDEHIAEFKQRIDEADAVIISTPEYAFGVPGTLKNALDWTVHSGNLNTKPVLVLSCSPLHDGAKRAMASLLLTLSALGTHTKENEHLCIGNIYNKMSPEGTVTDGATISELKVLIEPWLESLKTNHSDQ
ncbi:MAG: NAD(P)H-dependent oxidoreductase [Bacteroidia bacterium]|nr:NAD(P)H-dependent oxidoreductase [Bacteroidia bacterium]